MQKINKEQFENLAFKSRHYHGIPNPVLDAVKELGVGEGLVVEKGEWPRKSAIGVVLHTIRGRSFSVRRLANDNGHAIIRKS